MNLTQKITMLINFSVNWQVDGFCGNSLPFSQPPPRPPLADAFGKANTTQQSSRVRGAFYCIVHVDITVVLLVSENYGIYIKQVTQRVAVYLVIHRAN